MQDGSPIHQAGRHHSAWNNTIFVKFAISLICRRILPLANVNAGKLFYCTRALTSKVADLNSGQLSQRQKKKSLTC